MVNKNVINLLGLASRSKNVVCGELVLNAIRSGSAKLVIIAENASDNTRKKFVDKCTYYKIPYVFMESSEEMSHAIGKQNRMVLAITNKGFAEKIQENMKG